MSQYIIKLPKSKQADALLAYLQTLDFVQISALRDSDKEQAIKKATSFLKGLPKQSSKQDDVNKATKSIRKKYGYQ